MTDRGPRATLIAAFLSLATIQAAGALEVPFLAGRVNDLAEILSPEAEQRIDTKLQSLEQELGPQVAVLTIPSLEGENLEDYSLRVAETWRLGRADVDDGVLLLVVRDDRKMRIEVGYGLEGTLTDAYSRRILDEILRPRFRTGDFDGGIERGLGAVVAMIEGNDTLPTASPTRSTGRGASGCSLLALVLVAPFVLGVVRAPGCGAWIFYFLLMPFIYGLANTLAGQEVGLICLGVWVVLFPILRAVLGRSGAGGTPFFGGGGGWSSSGGSFSGGGFSGGGGSFGGGGSSSGW